MMIHVLPDWKIVNTILIHDGLPYNRILMNGVTKP